MTQVIKNNNQNLLQILVAIAWIDGEIQSEEKEFLSKIALEGNICSAAELDKMLEQNQDSSSEKCYQLLTAYLGKNPSSEDYNNLLSAVSRLIYSDNDIATEEASLLNKIQNLDPQNSSQNSVFDKVISKIQNLYQAGLSKK